MFYDNLKDISLQDCAVSEHINSCRDLFTNFSSLRVPTVIKIGDVTKLRMLKKL